MYEKPVISTEPKYPGLVCGIVGCGCERQMNQGEVMCHWQGAYYCWCSEGMSHESHAH